MSKIKIFIFFVLLVFPVICRAMPPGTLLYRTSGNGKMYGYSSDPLIYAEKGIVKNIYSGHVAIYIGRENGEDYIVEALGDGIVKTPAKYFVNSAEGEIFLGAKMPSKANALQQAKAVLIAKSLVGRKLAYDYDFHYQKGPGSGEWTCVGLTEKIYESANVSNPNNLGALEYDPNYYAVDITPDGFDNYSTINSEGDCFSRDREFSKIAARRDLLVPAPELIGFDVGLEKAGERYIFLPYTQFLQKTLEPVKTDIVVSSSFSGIDVRGAVDTNSLVLRWSLINNPLSSLKIITGSIADLASQAVSGTKALAADLNKKLFGTGTETEVVLDNNEPKKKNSSTVSTTDRKVAVNKASSTKTAKNTAATVETSTTAKKTTSTKATSTKKVATKATSKATASTKKAAVKTASTKSVSTKSTSTKKVAVKNSVSKTTSSEKVSTKDIKSDTVKAAATYYNPINIQKSDPIVNQSSSNSTKTTVNQEPARAIINRIYNTANNHWIELYNPTDSDLDLVAAGYRLEKTKTSEDPSLIARIGNVLDGSYSGGTKIKAHSTYLIVSAESDSYYKNKAQALITRDEFDWNSSGYTIYLGNGPISSSGDSNIVDAVGFGSDATYYQGAGPAPEIKFNYFLKRTASTGNNNKDFSLFLTDHSSTPPTESSPEHNESDPDQTPVNGTSTSSTATSSDPIIGGGSAVINKIYATGDNDWVELFNSSDHDFDLGAAGYRLEKTKTSEDPSLMMRIGDIEDGIYPKGTIIKAHSKYLIVRSQAGSYYKNQADAIATRDDFGWTGSDYTIYLGNGAISSSTDPNIIDVVGFGDNATFFQGSGPAVGITDNYYLNRLSYNNDNRLDFNLLPSDDPSIATSSESAVNPYLFIPPIPIKSAGLVDLWHFDDCYGAGSWGIGKWECAKNLGYGQDKFYSLLSTPVPLNNFSVSFYYKKSADNFPRLDLYLKKSAGGKVRLAIEPDMITIEGLPNTAWRYYKSVPFDDSWHKATLVVDQSLDYWELYIDGKEMIKESFLADLSSLSDVEVGGDCGPFLLEELAVWNRSLSAEEIYADYIIDAPYSPTIDRTPQRAARLLHFWDFSEYGGLTAADSVGNASLSVDQNNWTGRSHNNYAIKTENQKEYIADFAEPVNSQDVSLAFWWRNTAYPNEGRAHIYLKDKSGNSSDLLAIMTNSSRLGYLFDGKYGILAQGDNTYIPNDDNWHYLALVYDSYRYKLSFYVDGEEKASSSLIWWPVDKQIDQLKITSDSYGSEIDELGVWEGALNIKQIKEIYTNNK